jgi:hypothetical protein
MRSDDRGFFPTGAEKRQRWQYQGPAVSIMDGFGWHHSDVFDRASEARNIRVLFPVQTNNCANSLYELIEIL